MRLCGPSSPCLTCLRTMQLPCGYASRLTANCCLCSSVLSACNVFTQAMQYFKFSHSVSLRSTCTCANAKHCVSVYEAPCWPARQQILVQTHQARAKHTCMQSSSKQRLDSGVLQSSASHGPADVSHARPLCKEKAPPPLFTFTSACNQNLRHILYRIQPGPANV